MALSHEPAVPLYLYQKTWIADRSKFKIGMMSRQSGKTFVCTLEIVDDCLEQESIGRRARWVILSRGERQAKEAMEEGVKRHLAAYRMGFEAYEYDWDPDIKAQEIILPQGSRITALPANPDTARGFSANLLLDEFAFHKDSRGIWKACFPLVSKPGLKLRIISTPNGKSNRFYELMTAKDAGWSSHVTDIYQAVKDGLPRDIKELRSGINDPDAWEQEYECRFIDEATAFITYEMIAACEDDKATIEMACGAPSTAREFFLGVDIGRKKDLTVMWLWELVGDVLWTRAVTRLFRERFSDQRDVLFGTLPFVRRACIDATGLGMQLAEEAADRFGSKVEPVTFTRSVKEDLAVTIRRRYEDRTIRIPIDRQVRDDMHSVKKVTTTAGNIRFDAERTEDGHADHFWAAALGLHAASTPTGEIDYQTVSRRTSLDTGGDDGEMRPTGTYGRSGGAW